MRVYSNNDRALVSLLLSAKAPHHLVAIAIGSLYRPEWFARFAARAVASPGLRTVRKHIGSCERGIY